MIRHKKPKIAVVVGTRPNFIKVAPFIHQNKKQDSFNLILIHTGQHFDDNMSRVFFKELDIPEPDVNLNVGKINSSDKMFLVQEEMEKIFVTENIDAVVVFGDVNSTLAGAKAAANVDLPIIHVESGLRSFDERMPEEANRVTVDHLSSLLFVTEDSAMDNLRSEEVDENKIHFVGNIMIESLEIFKEKIDRSEILRNLSLNEKSYILATIHRQENTNNAYNLEKILKLLDSLSLDFKVIFPLHPGTKNKIEEFNLGNYLKNLEVIDPVSYFDFIKLTKESYGVVTDSGGIQEETSHLGVPCCTLRDNTERPITVTSGSNKLFSIEDSSVDDLMEHLGKKFKPSSIPLWDAKVSERIFEVLIAWYFN